MSTKTGGNRMTCKEICEIIEEAKILFHPDNTPLTAEEIFNYSPTGELYMLQYWYVIATEKLKRKKEGE